MILKLRYASCFIKFINYKFSTFDELKKLRIMVRQMKLKARATSFRFKAATSFNSPLLKENSTRNVTSKVIKMSRHEAEDKDLLHFHGDPTRRNYVKGLNINCQWKSDFLLFAENWKRAFVNSKNLVWQNFFFFSNVYSPNEAGWSVSYLKKRLK